MSVIFRKTCQWTLRLPTAAASQLAQTEIEMPLHHQNRRSHLLLDALNARLEMLRQLRVLDLPRRYRSLNVERVTSSDSAITFFVAIAVEGTIALSRRQRKDGIPTRISVPKVMTEHDPI